MFFLIPFVLGGNYCIGIGEENCTSLCKTPSNYFNKTFDHIPTSKDFNTDGEDLNTDSEEKHNLYFAISVDYSETKNNLIFCDPSIHLIYSEPVNSIRISDHTYINSISKPLLDAHILFNVNQDINIIVDKEEKVEQTQVILNATKSVKADIKFYVEDFTDKLISISPLSNQIKVLDKRESILKVFNDTKKLDLIYNISYYCISDKSSKCSDYKNPLMKYIDSASEIIGDSSYVIIETTKPQNIRYNNFLHIIAKAGSEIYYEPFVTRDKEFYAILHSNSIEMFKMYIEGEGKVHYSANHNISIHSTTKICSIDFQLESDEFLNFYGTNIYPLKDGFTINMDKKIHIPEYFLFRGPECLSGMFEPERYLNIDEFLYNGIETKDLKEYDYLDLNYYLKNGEFEVPKDWKKTSRFHGIDPEKTTIVFDDIYVFDGYRADIFMVCNSKSTYDKRNQITIIPARYFYLDIFSYADNKKPVYTIKVTNDVYMLHDDHNSHNSGNLDRSQCIIRGNGKIKFDDLNYLEFIKNSCQILEDVKLEHAPFGIPKVSVCIGKSDLDKCKAEIKNIDSTDNYEWLWFRNIATVSFIQNYMNIQRIYFTDKHEISLYDYFSDINSDIILTEKADVTINRNSASIYSDHIDNIYAESPKPKLTYFLYNDNTLDVFYHENPSNIYFTAYFRYDSKIRIKYVSDYAIDSIKLRGECDISIREYLLPKVDIFRKPDTINFVINDDVNYREVLYADAPIENDNLIDFVICNTHEKLMEYISYSSVISVFIYKNVQIDFSDEYTYYNAPNFYFYNKINANIEISNDALIRLSDSKIKVGYGVGTPLQNYYLFNEDNGNKFIFNVKDFIYLDIDQNSIVTNLPTIEFTGTKHTVEILPDPYVKEYKNEYLIKVHKDLSFVSPTPQYLVGILDTNTIDFSPNYCYLYISEKGKELYQSNPYKLFNILENFDNTIKDIVIAVGEDDILTIPPNWANDRNIYLLQESTLYINRPGNILVTQSYLFLDYKFKIIMGNVTLYVPSSFQFYVTNNFNNRFELSYNVTLDCSQNSHTYLNCGDLNIDDPYKVLIKGYDSSKTLTINAKNYNNYNNAITIFEFYSDSGYDFSFDYESCCFYDIENENEVKKLCPSNSFSSTKNEDLNSAISAMSNLPIYIGSNFIIDSYPKDLVFLHPLVDNIQLTFPDYCNSLSTANQVIQLGYPDSSSFNIEKGSITIFLNINESLRLDIRSSVQSSISLDLVSDVYLRTKSKITSKVNFYVKKNGKHLYVDDKDMFGGLFGDLLEEIPKKCFHDAGSSSYCLCKNRDLIDNIFKEPFDYQALEIVLMTTPKEIKLPSISKSMNIDILENSLEALSIEEVSTINIISDTVTVNDYWKFMGNTKTLILKLEKSSTLSINEQITEPITFQLTSDSSTIKLLNCKEISTSKITILKYGTDTNDLTIYGSYEIVTNFIRSLAQNDGVNLIYNEEKKYHCICNSNQTCDKCKSGINGIITTSDTIINDPGINSDIRFYSDFEVSSQIFTIEHDAVIDDNVALNITDVTTIDQYLDKGFRIDKLWFTSSVSNKILVKPQQNELNIITKKTKAGPNLFIEVNQYLKLNDIERKFNAPNLYISGNGELNVNNYPIEKIINTNNVKLIKGIYLICRDSKCDFDTNYNILGSYNDFKNDFDELSKIIVFLSSFRSNIDANLSDLNGQKVEIDPNSHDLSVLDLLETDNKLRFTSTTELLYKADSTMKLSNPKGGALIDNFDSDMFIVGFDSTLTIKQEANCPPNMKTITIQPMNEEATIFIDKSIDMENQKIKIIPEEDKETKVTVQTNKENIDEEILNNFIENDDDDKLSFIIEKPVPTNPKKKKSFPIGAIIGIVVGAVVIIAVIIIIVVFVVKKKKQDLISPSCDNKGAAQYIDSINHFDDSSF